MTIQPELIELSLREHFTQQSFELFVGSVASVVQILHNAFSCEEEVAMSCFLTRLCINGQCFDLSYFHHPLVCRNFA